MNIYQIMRNLIKRYFSVSIDDLLSEEQLIFMFPFMKTYIDHLTERNYQNRTIGLIENGSWAPNAAKVMKAEFEKSKNITWLDTTVKIMSSLSEENMEQLDQMAEELCK